MTSEKTLASSALDTAAAAATQSFAPLSSICETVCGLHFYSCAPPYLPCTYHITYRHYDAVATT
jgi:hypothetical protein